MLVTCNVVTRCDVCRRVDICQRLGGTCCFSKLWIWRQQIYRNISKYQASRRHIPEQSSLYIQHRKNFKSYNVDGIENKLTTILQFVSWSDCRIGLSNKIYGRFIQLCRWNQLDPSFNSDWFRCISDRNVADICIILCYNEYWDIFLHGGAKGDLFSFRSCHDDIRGHHCDLQAS